MRPLSALNAPCMAVALAGSLISTGAVSAPTCHSLISCVASSKQELGITERGARHLMPQTLTIETPQGPKRVKLAQGGTLWGLVREHGGFAQTTPQTETLVANTRALTRLHTQMASLTDSVTKLVKELRLMPPAPATARVTPAPALPRERAPLIAVAGEPLPAWSLWLSGGLLVLLVALAGFGSSHLLRATTRRVQRKGPQTEGPVIENPRSIVGSRITCTLSPERVQALGARPVTFDADITRYELTRATHNGRAWLGAILYGYGPWDKTPSGDYYRDCDPVEVGRLDEHARLRPTSSAFTKMIDAAPAGTSPRAERIRTWLAGQNATLITTRRAPIVLQKDMRLAA